MDIHKWNNLQGQGCLSRFSHAIFNLLYNITTNQEEAAKLPSSNTMKNSSMKNSHNVCLPNLLIRNKTSIKSGNNKPIISPISLLDRLREAMLRLFMLAAISKSASSARSHNNNYHANNLRQSYSSPSSRNDPHHSQAVADCIDFIKKKSAYGCVLDEDLVSNGRDLSSGLDTPIVDASHHQLGVTFSVM